MEKLKKSVQALKQLILASRPNIKFRELITLTDSIMREIDEISTTQALTTLIASVEEHNNTINDKEVESLEENTKADFSGEEGIEGEDGVEDENMTEIIVEDEGFDFTYYESLSLSELRERYPDIKARSKQGFLEELAKIK